MSILSIIKAFADSFSIIRQAKLKKFYFIPGIIGILLFAIFIGLGDLLTTNLTQMLEDFFKIGEYHSILYVLLRVVIWFITILFYYLVYKSLLLIIISPMLAYVSEKVEKFLTGKEYHFGVKDNMSFIARGVNIGLRSFVKQMIATCLIMLLGFIFPINLSIPVIIFVMQGYFTGFAFMDYTLERYELSPQESMEFLKKQRVCSAVSGIIFTGLFFIPVLGIFIAPLVTCVAVTKITVELLNKE